MNKAKLQCAAVLCDVGTELRGLDTKLMRLFRDNLEPNGGYPADMQLKDRNTIAQRLHELAERVLAWHPE